MTKFEDAFFARVKDEHIAYLDEAASGSPLYIDWFRSLMPICKWLESLEPLRAVSREQVIEAMINDLEYAEGEERAYQVGEIVGRVSRRYEMMVKRFYPDMYWLALGKRCLYLDL